MRLDSETKVFYSIYYIAETSHLRKEGVLKFCLLGILFCRILNIFVIDTLQLNLYLHANTVLQYVFNIEENINWIYF